MTPARHNPARHRQRGAALITVALTMFLLLGFIGAALDFARLFVVKTELQTALDACALSAAQELDHQAGALARGTSAGITAGNANNVGFQSPTWGGLGKIATGDITFRDANYAATSTDTQATYAVCRHTVPSPTWLLQALGAFGGNSALAATSRNVAARAVATRASAQTTCPLPLALRPKAGGVAPNYGFNPGDWVTLIMTNDTGAGGYIGWANLDGTNSAANTVAEINGFCGVTVGTNLGTPGVQSTVVDNWNWRFGIYKNNQGPGNQYQQPDMTGYSYTTANWPTGSSAYNGPVPAGAAPGADNFVNQRLAYANCIDSTAVSGVQSVHSCETLLGVSLNGEANLLPGGTESSAGHRRYGGNRRLVLVPVTNGYPGSVQDFVCMLMLQPLSIPMQNVQLEYIGNAAAAGSPCAASGLPGGSAGPLVPVLVR